MGHTVGVDEQVRVDERVGRPGQPVPFDFRPRRPGPPLAGLVESIWYARGTVPYARERIGPTGSTVAVFVLGDAILQTPSDGSGPTLAASRGFLVGPHDRPTVNEPTGETHAVGIVATPVGCEALFGLAPASLRGRVVDLETAWSPAAGIRAELVDTAEPETALDVVERRLVELHDPDVPGIDRCRRAVALLEADPVRPIGDVADEVGVSHSHLDREFTRVVGLTPRVLARLLRIRRLLASIDVHGEVGWAAHAADLGWFDQAHLIRDFRRHTGVTPSQYLAAQRQAHTTIEGGDAAGFVPEG